MVGLIVSFVWLLCLFSSVISHGRLIQPSSRSSMWRLGFDTPKNYNDNELNCGGFNRHYITNGGRCGVCGDPFDGARENEPGGIYANGIIVASFRRGQVIEVIVEITANHRGWMEFRVCPHGSVTVPVSQECLDENVLEVDETQETQVSAGTSAATINSMMKLPDGIICEHCVIQWRYHAGNSWGTNPDGSGCLGCGEQEEFYGCADISISDSTDDMTEPDGSGDVEQQSSEWTGDIDSNGDTEDVSSETQSSESTPPDHGSSGATLVCSSTGLYQDTPGMNEWCTTNCAVGYCPESHCKCSPQDSTTYEEIDYENQPSEQYDDESESSNIESASDTSMYSYDYESSSMSEIESADELDIDTLDCASFTAIGAVGGIPFANEYCHMMCQVENCPNDVCACSSSQVQQHLKCYARQIILRSLPGMNEYCQIVCDDRWCPVECMCDEWN